MKCKDKKIYFLPKGYTQRLDVATTAQPKKKDLYTLD